MKGIALIPALVGLLLLSILIAAVSVVTSYFTRETQSLAEKLEIIQIQQSLFGVLNTSALCSCNFDSSLNTSNSSPLYFDSSNLPTARISLDRVFSSCRSNTPANPILIKNQRPSNSGAGVQVRDIVLENIQTTGTAGMYFADLVVSFESSSMVMGRRPAKVGLNIQADLTNPGQARILNCSTGNPVAGNGNPPGQPGANCGPGNSGVIFQQVVSPGVYQPMCCTLSPGGTSFNCVLN